MFILKIAYDDNSEKFIKELEFIIPAKYPLLQLETYHESLFKERAKAFKLKGGYSARKNPFAILLDDIKVVRAFYTESNDCTLDSIINSLNTFLAYD